MITHEFHITIEPIPNSANEDVWWVAIYGSGALHVRIFGKQFLTEQEAVDFAKGYLAGYRENHKEI